MLLCLSLDRELSSLHWEAGRETKGESDEDKEEVAGNAFVRTFSFLYKMTSSRKVSLKPIFCFVIRVCHDTFLCACFQLCSGKKNPF